MIRRNLLYAAAAPVKRIDHDYLERVGDRNRRRFQLLFECAHAVAAHVQDVPVDHISLAEKPHCQWGDDEHPETAARIALAPIAAFGIELQCKLDTYVEEIDEWTTTTRRRRARMPSHLLRRCGEHVDDTGMLNLLRGYRWVRNNKEELERLTLSLYQHLKPLVIDQGHDTVYSPTSAEPSTDPTSG